MLKKDAELKKKVARNCAGKFSQNCPKQFRFKKYSSLPRIVDDPLVD